MGVFLSAITSGDRGITMNLYAIMRRDGFTDGAALEAASKRSKSVGDEMEGDLRWIRSYVLDEGEGALGTICIYQAISEEAIRKHAAQANLPVDEVILIADTAIGRPDTS